MKIWHLTFLFCASILFINPIFGTNTFFENNPTVGVRTELLAQHNEHEHNHDHSNSNHSSTNDNLSDNSDHPRPEPWSVIPFVVLLLMIATGPIFYPHFWHKFYPLVSGLLGTIVVSYYLFFLHDFHHPVHSLSEYLSFIALLSALFVASGGILIKVDKEGTPMVNVILLLFGAVLANVIGTTGASMLLIRPFIRLNKNRIKPYHIVLFIFIVSNVGGSLTPIGDPPLFLGFLKGVPFFWTVSNLFVPWLFGIGLLSLIFYFIDRRNHSNYDESSSKKEYTGKITIKGKRSTIWLAITIGAVFIDPNVMDWVPYIPYDGAKLSFLREIIMFSAAFLAFRSADKASLKGNEFDFEPIREVAFLFIGIFATMMPALHLISEFANSAAGSKMITTDSLYWFTGTLSGILDNAPTYLNFLAAGMGKVDLEIGSKTDVIDFVNTYSRDLSAISIAAVFFGAFTYIGNAPNFMVKSIAEQTGINMPAFISYIVRYSIPLLLPVLLLTWFVFFCLF